MRKLIVVALFALIVTACTQTGTQSGMMQSGTMCEKCPCCQKMMEGGMMKDGMQCPMMKGNKDGKSCGCCQSMMESSMKEGMQCPMMKDGKPCSCCEKMMQNQSAKPVAKKTTNKPVTVTGEDHKQHHPAQ